MQLAILDCSVGYDSIMSLMNCLLALLGLFAAHACAAHSPRNLQSRGSPAYLSRASQVTAAPAPIDEAYTKAAEEDRIDELPGWGKPDFGLFSGMCQDAPASLDDPVEGGRAPRPEGLLVPLESLCCREFRYHYTLLAPPLLCFPGTDLTNVILAYKAPPNSDLQHMTMKELLILIHCSQSCRLG